MYKLHKTCNSINNKSSIVVGLGNFDGVHTGHQQLMKELISLAAELNSLPVIITFDPHPQQVLDAEHCPKMLLPRDEKEKKIKESGVNLVIWLPFSLELAALSPEDFVNKILVAKYNCRGVVVGYNYTFGCGGQGTAETMLELGTKYNLKVLVVPPVSIDGCVVSSTAIRNYMMQGEIKKAAGMLGYYPAIKGKVVSGDRRGSKIGFPTANLDVPEDILIPCNGVYAVRVVINNNNFLGVANIGTRPTFYGAKSSRNIEVHLLDFYGNLYGKQIRVVFKKRIRGEKAFSSAAELVEQIKADIELVRVVNDD